MPCSHCGQVGHTYVKCPQLTPEQVKEKKEAIKKEKEEKIKRKKMRERHAEVYKNKNYTFFNDKQGAKWSLLFHACVRACTWVSQTALEQACCHIYH